jgi:hypothetical protein
MTKLDAKAGVHPSEHVVSGEVEREQIDATTSTSMSTIVGLGAVGLLNSILAFVFLRAVQKAISALTVASSPPGTVSMGGTESATDSFWS